MGENIVAMISIYGDRAISLRFYDHQDNVSESREIEIGVVGPIIPQKNFKCPMGK